MDVKNILILFFVLGILINLFSFMFIIYNLKSKNLKGPAGEDGPRGPRGPRGDKGEIGPAPNSMRGFQGLKGRKGQSGIPFWGLEGEKKIIPGMNAVGCKENVRCRIPGQVCVSGDGKVNTICCGGKQKLIDYSKVSTNEKIKLINCGNFESD